MSSVVGEQEGKDVNIEDVIAALPTARRADVAARARILDGAVRSSSAFLRLAGKARVEITARLKVRQPTVSRIEKQTDMYLSTLRDYVEAMGGRLTVRLPAHPPVHLDRLGSLGPEASVSTSQPAATGRARPARAPAEFSSSRQRPSPAQRKPM